MAAGDILSVEILADGFSADVTIEGVTPTGVTYDYGYAGTILGTPKIAFAVTSLGFDATGTATTYSRQVNAAKTVRLPYPNQATLDETDNTGSMTVRVALDECIYAKDKAGAGNSGTNVSVAFLSGWANKGATVSNSATLTATNNSAISYPRMVCKRAWFNFEKIQASSYMLEVIPLGHFVRQNRPFACVKYSAADESSNTVAATLTTWEKSERSGPIPIVVCRGAISLATLDKHELVTAHIQAYPWIGDEASVVDTLAASESDLNPDVCGPVYFFNDKDSDYPSSCAFVDITSGSDSTGVAAALTDTATASATPFKTIINAREAIVARNLAQHGRQDLNGAVIYIKAGSHQWVGDSTTNATSSSKAVRNTDKCELLITRDPASAIADCIIHGRAIFGGDQNQIKTQRYRLFDLTIGETTANNARLFQGTFEGNDCAVYDSCRIVNTRTGTAFSYRHAASVAIGNVGVDVASTILQASDSVSSVEKMILVRGNSGSFRNSASKTTIDPYCAVGNDATRLQCNNRGEARWFFFMNRLEVDATGAMLTKIHSGNITDDRIVGNVFVNVVNTSTVSYQISAESGLGEYKNAIIAYNSFLGANPSDSYIGGRVNLIYSLQTSEDKGGNRVVGNYFRNINFKTDVFGESPTSVGNWPTIYGTSYRANAASRWAVNESEFAGEGSKIVSDNSLNLDFANPTDTAAGGMGGDYTPGDDSDLLGMSQSDFAFLPYDIEGNVRQYAGGAIGGLANLLEANGSPFSVVASADSATVPGSTVGIDATPFDGVSPYSYAWTVTSEPSVGAAVFDDDEIAGPTVTFSKAGSYTFEVTVTDDAANTATDEVTVTVLQTATGITLSPASQTLYASTSKQFTQSQVDQFGDPMVFLESVTWSVDGGGLGGTINTSGLYTAPSGSGSDTVRATTNTTAIADTSVVTVGTPVFPTAGQMIVGASAGITGSLVDGTVVLPAEAEVENGVLFGPASSLEGTLVAGGGGGIDPPASPLMSLVAVLCLDEQGQPEADVLVDLRVVSIPTGDTNVAYKGNKQTAISGVDGIATIEAPRGSRCQIKRGPAADWKTITIADAVSTDVESIIGSP
jgi:hypothetical protein